MDDERITVSFTRDEFSKFFVNGVIDDDKISEATHLAPHLLLFLTMISSVLWRKLEEYSRMQQIIKTITEPTSKEDK